MRGAGRSSRGSFFGRGDEEAKLHREGGGLAAGTLLSGATVRLNLKGNGEAAGKFLIASSERPTFATGSRVSQAKAGTERRCSF